MGTDDHVKRPQLNGRSIPTSLSAAASVTDGRTDEESFRNIVAVFTIFTRHAATNIQALAP